MSYSTDDENRRPPRSAVGRFAANLATVLVIAVSTGVAWLIYGLLSDTSVERIFEVWAQWLANHANAWFDMDATTAAVVIPLAGFLVMAVVVYLFARRSR